MMQNVSKFIQQWFTLKFKSQPNIAIIQDEKSSQIYILQTRDPYYKNQNIQTDCAKVGKIDHHYDK